MQARQVAQACHAHGWVEGWQRGRGALGWPGQRMVLCLERHAARRRDFNVASPQADGCALHVQQHLAVALHPGAGLGTAHVQIPLCGDIERVAARLQADRARGRASRQDNLNGEDPV